MAGRPRKPRKVLEMQGTERKCRMDARGPELELPVATPEPFSWMSKGAKAEWRELVAVSEYAVVISNVDRPVLAAFCELFAEFVASRKPRRGSEKPPDFQISKLIAMINLAGKLGLTPSDRARIRMPEKKPTESKFAQLKANG